MTTSTREQRRRIFEQYIGQVVAQKYTLTGLLGFGGMGAVYEAIQAPMDRKVALKLIPTHDPTAAARFEREAYTISRLNHPNTVTVFDFGQTQDGQLYLAMEYCEGQTLTDLIQSQGPLPGERVVHITDQICRSLAEAHKAGIIHRDIKPDNILLIHVDGNPDYVKVLDFGIAKAVHGEEDANLTADGRIVGTPKYMSPEQILATPTDHRADIYSLGCIMHEMLTGRPPFEANSSAKLMMFHAQSAPPRFSERLSPEVMSPTIAKLEQVVRRAMAKSPDERPASTDDLRQEMSLVTNIPLSFTGTNPQMSVPSMLPPAFDRTQFPTGEHTPQQHLGAEPSYPFENQTGNFAHQTGSFGQPGHAATNPMMAAPPAASSNTNSKLLVAGVIILALICAALAFVAFGMSDDVEGDPVEKEAVAKKADTAEAAPTKPAEKDEPTAPAVDPDAPKTFKIISIPKGANVVQDGKVVGTTPFEVELAKGDAELIYSIELTGHRNEGLMLEHANTKLSHVVSLTKDPNAGKKSTSKGSRRAGSGKTRKPKDSTSTNKKVEAPSTPVEDKKKTVVPMLDEDDDTTKVDLLD